MQASSGDFTKMEMNAIERTLNNSCSQSLARKRDSYSLKSMFSKHFSSGWILLVPILSLLKHFDITLPRHKSIKIEGTGLPLMSHSMQFHCFCFHFSNVSERETVYTRWHMKGVHVSSNLQSFASVQFDLWEKIAKNRFKSYNSTANFSIFKNRFFLSTDIVLPQ